MTIGERIREVRKARKMSQTEFANLIGLEQTSVSMLEIGRRQVMERHIKVICAACGVSESWLRTGDGEMLDDSGADALVGKFKQERNLTPEDEAVVRNFLKLTDEQRATLLFLAHKMLDGTGAAPAKPETQQDRDFAEREAALRREFEREDGDRRRHFKAKLEEARARIYGDAQKGANPAPPDG